LAEYVFVRVSEIGSSFALGGNGFGEFFSDPVVTLGFKFQS
jgi:hypothetical protein